MVLAEIAARMAKWGSSFTPTRRASSTARTASVGATRAHLVYLPRVRLQNTRSPRQTRQLNVILPAISPEALKAKGVDLRAMRIHRRTDLS